MKAAIRCLIAMLMVVCVETDPALEGRIPLGSGASATEVNDDLDALLDGVAEVAMPPGGPGAMCVYGPEAFPVIVGAASSSVNGARAPVVAAGYWEGGRMVAVGSLGLLFLQSTLETAHNGRLMENALHWAAGKTRPDRPRIGVVGNRDLRLWLKQAGYDVVETALTIASLRTVDVVAMTMWDETEQEVSALLAFVRAGGGLVAQSSGWFWADRHPDLDLAGDFAGNRLLARVGIQWTGLTANPTSTLGFTVDGPPDELTHAARALDAVEANGLTQPELAQATYTLTSTLYSLPPDDTLFAPRLHVLIEPDEYRWPSAERPVEEADLLDRLAATLFVTENLRTPAESVRAHPAAADFPGSVPADAPRLSRTVTIDATKPAGHTTSPWSEPHKHRWHSTGLYAAPGELITVTVPSAVAAAGLHVRVGAHSDANWNRTEWTRMPEIGRRFPISSTTTLAANAFGGLIYVEVPVNADLGRITVMIEGAVAAPIFVLGETDPAEWRSEIRHAPAPWGEIAGRNMIVTIPASEVRDLDDPAAVAETWDRILDLNAELAAWPSPARVRPERFVIDRQTSHGYMHSGYPIVAQLDQPVNLVSVEHLRSEGQWGPFHEVGHNHQSRDWTFDGTVEVAVNLFTLYVYEYLCGIPVARSYREWADPRSQAMIANYDFDNPDFELWKREPTLALYMYVQLQQAFGWEAYRQVFATYRALSDAERPKNDDEKRDQWLVRFSRQVRRNLGPFFEAWGVPTSAAARASIGELPVWLPSEFSTLTIVSGNGQHGAPGDALARPLVVEVIDPYGKVLPGASVTFKVTAGDGKLSGRFSTEHVTSDALGRAELPFTLGPDPGPNTVVVSIGERELATFTAQGVGPMVGGLKGDYRTWHLPDGATLRLGKGAMGQGDRAVALSADGRFLAVASDIGVWLYEAATSGILALLPTERPVISVTFSIDGLLAAGMENSGIIQLWGVETGASRGTLMHPSYVTAVVFSPDGERLASGSWDQVIKLWDVESMREVGSWEVEGQGNSVSFISLDFSPDGSRLAAGLRDGTVRLWDVATRTEVAMMDGHADRVSSVSFSPGGALLASAGGWSDRSVRLWDVATQTEVAVLKGHTRDVRSVAFSLPDGATLASAGGWDATVRLWDVATGTEVATLDEHKGAVVSVTFSRGGGTLASGSADGTVLLRDVASGNVARLSGHTSMSSMALSPDGATLALGHKDGAVGLWNAETKTRIVTLKGHSHDVLALSFSADGKTLASASGDRTIKIWDARTGAMITALEGHTEGVTSAAFSTDGKVLASGTTNGDVWLWDAATWRRSSRLEGHRDRVASLSFSPDGQLLASGSWDRTFKIWNVNTRVPVLTRHGHTGSVHAVTFSPDGKTLASGAGDGDGTVRLWDLRTGTNSATFKNPYGVYSLAFFPDGELLASGIWFSVTVWNVETQEQIGVLEGPNRQIHSLAISRDGSTLATGASDGTILLWDVTQYLPPKNPDPDFDGDGTVGFSDFVQFAAKFGLSQGDEGYDGRYDLDGNGAIGFSDFVAFAGAFGQRATGS